MFGSTGMIRRKFNHTFTRRLPSQKPRQLFSGVVRPTEIRLKKSKYLAYGPSDRFNLLERFSIRATEIIANKRHPIEENSQ